MSDFTRCHFRIGLQGLDRVTKDLKAPCLSSHGWATKITMVGFFSTCALKFKSCSNIMKIYKFHLKNFSVQHTRLCYLSCFENEMMGQRPYFFSYCLISDARIFQGWKRKFREKFLNLEKERRYKSSKILNISFVLTQAFLFILFFCCCSEYYMNEDQMFLLLITYYFN